MARDSHVVSENVFASGEHSLTGLEAKKFLMNSATRHQSKGSIHHTFFGSVISLEYTFIRSTFGVCLQQFRKMYKHSAIFVAIELLFCEME